MAEEPNPLNVVCFAITSALDYFCTWNIYQIKALFKSLSSIWLDLVYYCTYPLQKFFFNEMKCWFYQIATLNVILGPLFIVHCRIVHVCEVFWCCACYGRRGRLHGIENLRTYAPYYRMKIPIYVRTVVWRAHATNKNDFSILEI